MSILYRFSLAVFHKVGQWSPLTDALDDAFRLLYWLIHTWKEETEK